MMAPVVVVVVERKSSKNLFTDDKFFSSLLAGNARFMYSRFKDREGVKRISDTLKSNLSEE
jgi:hypothetical protein